MDRDFADAVINFALRRDPERVAEVIANVSCQLEAKGYSAQEIAAAIDELLDERARPAPSLRSAPSPPDTLRPPAVLICQAQAASATLTRYGTCCRRFSCRK